MLKKMGEPSLNSFKALSTDDWNILSKHSNMETINLISSTETLTPDQLLEWLEAQKNNFNISFQKLEPRIGEYYEGSFSINLVKLDDNSGKEFLKELNNFFSPFFFLPIDINRNWTYITLIQVIPWFYGTMSTILR